MGTIGSVLVIGGGIGGTQASLDLAESGFKVYILEKTTSIGGVMAQLDKTFPTNDCSMCILSPKLVETGRHPNINLLMNSEIISLQGEAGNFTVKIKNNAFYVNTDKCTGCGVCAEHCPVEVIDSFNENLQNHKAIYVKYPQAVPLVFSIDKDHCIGCGVCEGVCKAKAVEYNQENAIKELNVGAIILAPGFDEFNPKSYKPYGYGKYPNVLSSIEFERILSASGPYFGMVIRPSDGNIPDKIAFIQCVGSRDNEHSNKYCSSVCCMYTAKEAVIAKEHQHQVHPTIFTMDVRAYGKDFDKYIDRAQDEYGIKYIHSRIADITENKDTHNLLITYEKENGEILKEEFNMVVLAVGLTPPESAKKLSKVLDFKLNEYGFCQTLPFSSAETTKKGIYVCGAFAAPKDIPETVMQASAAVSEVDVLLSSSKNTLVTKKEYPEELYITGDAPKIGVFICHCGINIGGVVNVPEVTEYAKSLPNVEYAENNLYTCSADTQTKIKEKIKEHQLNRVIVASCSPRTHEPLFQETIREAGLNRYLFEMANIRDQCSWVHMEQPVEATLKSEDLVRMAVTKANKIQPLQKSVIPMTHKALVIGGGVSGLTAALSFAREGYETFLIEQEKMLGGLSRQIFQTIEKQNVQDFLSHLISEVESQPNLTVYTDMKIEEIDGFVGNFKTKIRIHGDDLQELEHGIIVLATGAIPYKPTEYEYGQDSRVLTQMELEDQLITGELAKEINQIVMIQCVGSRNEEHPYCSRVCCSEAIKNAILVKDKYPEKEIIVLYRDIRTYGFKEQYYREARKKGVVFLRFDKNSPPEISHEGNNLFTIVDTKNIGPVKIPTDLLVLSVGMHPPYESNDILAPMLKVPLNSDKFFLEAHVKLRPVDFATEGIFLCGTAHSPKTIEESIMQSKAAVSRATRYLNRDEIEGEGLIANVNPRLCSACGLCVEGCAYNAISIDEEKRVAVVNAALCKGCGVCSANCRSSAIDLYGFSNLQIDLVIGQRD
ncbi:MAG: FAD-dependent oxidoreductase [Promethearchaeota archaeon]